MNLKPKQTNLGYAYGELDKTDQKEKEMKEAFTSDYNEMLTNPKKKLLVLGLHPELNTQSTRTLQTADLEDPFIQEDPETMKENELIG